MSGLHLPPPSHSIYSPFPRPALHFTGRRREWHRPPSLAELQRVKGQFVATAGLEQVKLLFGAATAGGTYDCSFAVMDLGLLQSDACNRSRGGCAGRQRRVDQARPAYNLPANPGVLWSVRWFPHSIVADRAVGEIYFKDGYVMDAELIGGGARQAIEQEVLKRGIKQGLPPLARFKSNAWPWATDPSTGTGPSSIDEIK